MAAIQPDSADRWTPGQVREKASAAVMTSKLAGRGEAPQVLTERFLPRATELVVDRFEQNRGYQRQRSPTPTVDDPCCR
jgi:hypothetical protein